MKRILYILLTSIVITSCASGSRLLISRGEMKKYKRVLIIPAYVTSPVIPKETEKQRGFNLYNKKYKSFVERTVNANKKNFDREAKDILTKSAIKFQAVMYKGDISKYLKSKKYMERFKNLPWKNNRFYLTQKGIAKIAAKYKVDAILFHQIIFWKRRELIDYQSYGNYSFSTYGPRDSLSYITTMYNSKGEEIFTNFDRDRIRFVNIQQYKYSDRWLTGPVNAKLVEVTLQPKFVKYKFTKGNRAFYKPFITSTK